MTLCQAKSAYIFPGVTDLGRMRRAVGRRLEQWLSPRADLLSDLLSEDVRDLVAREHHTHLRGFGAQLLSYAASCAAHDAFHEERGASDFACGYSLGAFAALYAARSMSFEAGANLLHKLDKLVEDLCRNDGPFLMASVVGLTRDHIVGVVEQVAGVDIVNQNAEMNLVLSGTEAAIRALEDELLAAGALFFKVLPIDRPYHATFLAKSREKWRTAMAAEEIMAPTIPLVSPTTDRILATRKDCIDELANNYCSPFSWHALLRRTWTLGVRTMYECGPGTDLAKIGRYSGFDHEYHHIH